MSFNKETGMYEGYIYKVCNDIHPELVYIGQTIQKINYRWDNHLSDTRNNTYSCALHNMIRKYGAEHFTVEELEKYSCKTKKELISKLNEREIYNIELYDSYHNGLNCNSGGDNREQTGKLVDQYDFDGNLIATYKSIQDVRNVLNNPSAIYACCNGKCNCAYGYIWRYHGDSFDKYKLPSDRTKRAVMSHINGEKPIDKYDCLGNKVATYKNVKEAALMNNIKVHKLVSCCSGCGYPYIDSYLYRYSCDGFLDKPFYVINPLYIVQLDIDDNIIEIYTSLKDAVERSGIVTRFSIAKYCFTGDYVEGGYKWVALNYILEKKFNIKIDKPRRGFAHAA